MLIDTSVFVAIYNKEERFEELIGTISAAERRLLSVVSYVEVVFVTKNVEWIDGFIELADIELVDLTKQAAVEAANCFFPYGKGIHAARLNFGDCLVYGTAKATGAHLIFKGEDLLKTDVRQVARDGEEEL